MADEAEIQRETWLVAGWPGMGNVAIGACAHLVNQLEAPVVLEIPGEDHFELEHIEVEHGMVAAPRLPRSMIANSENPGDGPNLMIFFAEVQPQLAKFAFCEKVLDVAQQRGASKVVTFASMVTQLHPSAEPGVFAASTDEALLSELKRLELRTLDEGQIGGMNGVLLVGASRRGE